MTFIPLPNGATLCFDFVTAGQNWQFCLSIRKSTGAPTSTDLDAAVNDGVSGWNSDLKGSLTTATTLKQVRCTDMTVQGGPQSVQAVGTTGSGVGTATALSNALVVSLRTSKRGRSYRGRTYISGWDRTNMTDAVTVGASLGTNFVTFITNLQTALGINNWDLVVPSRQHNGTPTNPAELNEVIAVVADTKIDSQRRRLAGRGT